MRDKDEDLAEARTFVHALLKATFIFIGVAVGSALLVTLIMMVVTDPMG
jgi:hypothetical protein